MCEVTLRRMAVPAVGDDITAYTDDVAACLFLVGELAVMGLEDSKEGVQVATAGRRIPTALSVPMFDFLARPLSLCQLASVYVCMHVCRSATRVGSGAITGDTGAAAGAGAGAASGSSSGPATGKPGGPATARANAIRVKVPISSQLVTMTHALVSKSLFPSAAPGTAPGMQFQTLGTVNHSDLGGLTFGGTTADHLDTMAHMSGSVVEGSSVPVPPLVRAHAYVALGKLCLRDGALAKKVRPSVPAAICPVSPAASVLLVVVVVHDTLSEPCVCPCRSSRLWSGN